MSVCFVPDIQSMVNSSRFRNEARWGTAVLRMPENSSCLHDDNRRTRTCLEIPYGSGLILEHHLRTDASLRNSMSAKRLRWLGLTQAVDTSEVAWRHLRHSRVFDSAIVETSWSIMRSTTS